MLSGLSILALFILGAFYIQFDSLKPKSPTINVTSCPSIIPTEVKEYTKIDSSDCTEDKGYRTDLLQPTGLWLNRHFSCWTLEKPIEQFCKENPDYCNHEE